MKTTKTKFSLLACSLLATSNLYSDSYTVKDLKVTASNNSSYDIARSFVKYNTSINSTYEFIFTFDDYNFNGNSTVTVDYTDTVNAGILSAGKNFQAFFTNGQIAYGGTAVIPSNTDEALTYFKNNVKINDNSALLDFEFYSINYSSIRAIWLKSIQAQTVGNTIASDNKNAGKAAVTLQNIIDSSANYKQMDGVVNALNNLSSNKQVADAVDSTTPQTTTSSFTASNQISNNVSNIVSQRQNVNLNAGGLNSGDEMLSEKNIWIKPYGSKGSQDDKDGVNGFDIDTYGIGFGFDGEYAENKQIGFGFFYTNADVDVNNVSQTSDIDVYSLIVYGNTPILDNKTHFMYQLGYSWQDTSSNRGIEFMGKNAKADYTSKVASVDLKLIRDYRVDEKLLLQPLVSTTYRHFKSPNYSESGADALNLEVDKFTSSEFILGIGTLGFYKLNENSNLFGNVNIGYDLKDDNNIVSSSYQGASGLSFETEGIDNGRFSYDLGIGYENNINDLTNINFSYNFQGEGSDYTNHVISAKYTYKF
ncbi:MAG: autotransporter outer membrane beta-barrel domain-containing protein [Campylobacteraceae bacterium]|nr:autotransporter outer membrane beta-barrel domain-containing protein [Campylobacteraceae bacterium]